jgi:hypothetical protein
MKSYTNQLTVHQYTLVIQTQISVHYKFDKLYVVSSIF